MAFPRLSTLQTMGTAGRTFEPALNDTVFKAVLQYSMYGHFLVIKEACVLGILRAVEEYTDTTVPFITFKTRIMGGEEIHNYVRTMQTGFTVQSDDECRKLRNIMRLYAAYNKNDAETLSKISDEVGLSAKTVIEILQGVFAICSSLIFTAVMLMMTAKKVLRM